MKAVFGVPLAALAGGVLALVLLLIGHRTPVDGYDDPPYGDV